MSLQDANKALDKAKIGLMSKPDSAFFTTLCFSFRIVFDDTQPTAYVNDTTIGINPQFFLSLSEEERIFVLVHECMHPALMHTVRRGDRCPDKWNIAGDHVINLMLLERGFKMPDWVLKDAKYKGMSTLQVYDLLPDNPGQPRMQDLPPGPQSAEGQKQAEQHITDIIMRAATQSAMSGDKPGTIPGDIQIFLDEYLNPILPWDKLLRKFFNQFAKTDYTWKRPNRRFMPEHILPTLYGITLGEIAVAVDTSGSVSDSDFHRFISEVNGIMKKLKPSQITLLQFDTRIHKKDVLKSVSDLQQVTFHGRGGTNVSEVIQWARDNKPVALLVFSDGEFRHVMPAPKCPVLWVIHNNKKFTAPYGKVIHYNI